jgi:hypothetical protein
MTPIKRSRRLQAGLAGLSVVTALGAAVGLGLTTRTSADGAGSPGKSGRAAGPRVGDDDNEGRSGAASLQQNRQQGGPVAPPSSTAPQATTSGS